MAVFLLGLVAGRLTDVREPPSPRSAAPQELALARAIAVRDTGSRFTNPLLECELEGSTFQRELGAYAAQLHRVIDEELAAGRADHVSVYFRDLNNGPWTGVNEDEKFSPASLLKVPLMMAYLKQGERDPGLLEQQATFLEEVPGVTPNISPAEQLEVGHTYSVDELLARMIVFSDNQAGFILLDYIDPQKLEQVYRHLGVVPPGPDVPEDYMTVKAYASFFRIMFNASYLSREMSEKALEYLSRSAFDKGLRAGVPAGIPVASKFGERGLETGVNQLHDCGIIYFPAHPYLLCVMTRGRSFDVQSSVIARLSRVTYAEVYRRFAQSANGTQATSTR